jgi:AAA domain
MSDFTGKTGSGAAAAQTSGRHNVPATGHTCEVTPNGQSDYNPFEKTDTPLAAAEAERTQTEKRCSRWGKNRYALSMLDGNRERWALELALAAQYTNAKRDPEKTMPVLMFKGDEAVNAGATDEEITALPRLSPDEIANLQIEAAALRAQARKRVKMREVVLSSPRPPLTEVIRVAVDMVDDPPTGVIVDGLLYEETVTSWPGAGGSYKTFTVLAMACSVAAGRDFAPRLRVPEKRPVLVMCAERRRHGLIGDIRAWCAANGVDIGGLYLHGWDGVVQLGDDAQMAELTGYVIAHGIKMVVFDTQRKATRGLEENSSTDMSAAVANAMSLARAAKCAVIVIHHTGWGGEHARGSSVWHDDTDATVMQEGTGPNEAEFVIEKHKSEPVGTRYPIRLEAVTVERAPVGLNGSVAVPCDPIRTLVAFPRDPMTTDEDVQQAQAVIDHRRRDAAVALANAVHEVIDALPDHTVASITLLYAHMRRAGHQVRNEAIREAVADLLVADPRRLVEIPGKRNAKGYCTVCPTRSQISSQESTQ